jgi:hypothetical protein
MPKSKKIPTTVVNLKIIPTKDEISERIYSNFVSISHSEYDFTLTFCDINAPRDDQKSEIIKSKKIQAPIQAEITIPIMIVEPLIKALMINYDKYKKSQKVNEAS